MCSLSHQSLGDNDTLVVNETILDDSHEVVEDDAIEPTSVSRTPVTRIPEDVLEERRVSSNRTAALLHPSQNLSAVSSMCQSEVSLSGTNFEGRVSCLYFSLISKWKRLLKSDLCWREDILLLIYDFLCSF